MTWTRGIPATSGLYWYRRIGVPTHARPCEVYRYEDEDQRDYECAIFLGTEVDVYLDEEPQWFDAHEFMPMAVPQ